MNSKLLIGVCGVVIALGIWRVMASRFVSGAGAITPSGMPVMNPDTGYRFTIEIDEDFAGWPVKCPDTGQVKCYPAELCRSKTCSQEPGGGTWVVLNKWLGKSEQTLCPRCGSPVKGHNWDAETAPAPQSPDAKKDSSKKPRTRGRRGSGP